MDLPADSADHHGTEPLRPLRSRLELVPVTRMDPSRAGGPSRVRLTILLVALAVSVLALVWRPVARTVRGAAGARVAGIEVARDDPVAPMIRRTDDCLQRLAVGGVTMDWRYAVIPAEEIRQTVVCQLLAYVELARLDGRPRLRREITRHADFLVARMDSIRSRTPFDGMLAYSLLGAYEIIRDRRYLVAATPVVRDLLAIPTTECVLNGGLMVAMATAKHWQVTGDARSEQKAHDIVAGLAPSQNPDGSFPHWCAGSRDIHYTAWMAMELIHIGRMTHDSRIEPMLSAMSRFLDGRIGPDGRAIYQDSRADSPGRTNYYYSRATGCPQDLDSRGWTVEPAYCALLFDRQGSANYRPVMAFLDSLEVGGTVPDLYGYRPPPSDPEYPWTIADTSVVCMSINLWALSTLVADRVHRGVPVDLVLDDLDSTAARAPYSGPFLSSRASATPR